MSSNTNKRILDLVAITSGELSLSDLLLLEDISPVPQTKKLSLLELQLYCLNNGNLTGSFYGTSSWSINSLSSSYSPYQDSASYATTSSYSFTSITSSHAIDALSASYAKSSSYAITASYALTSSVQLIYSSAFADYSKTASYLSYTPGIPNGICFESITSSYSLVSQTSRFLTYTPGISNGTSSNALTSSRAITASHLQYNGSNNGTASHAMVAEIATTATTVTSINNDYIYREFGMFQCDLLNSDTTASIGAFQVDSNANNPSMIIEAWGDVKILGTASLDSSSLSLNIINVDLPINVELDKTTIFNYVTSSNSSDTTSSLILPVYLKGKTTLMGHYSASIFKMGELLTFYTGSRPFLMSVKVNSDDFTMDI